MDPAAQIIVVGSHAPAFFLRVRHVPKAGETVLGWDYQEPIDGGKGSNQAIAAARLGASVAFVGCVGKDRMGDAGEEWMQKAGVNTRYLRRSESTATGVGFILLDEQRVPAMVTSLGANAELSKTDIEDALIEMRQAKVMLTQFEIKPQIAMYAVEVAHRQNLIAIVNPAPAAVDENLSFDSVDILVPNETEAMQLLGMESTQEYAPVDLALNLRTKTRASTVIITLGERGIAGSDKLGVWIKKPPPVDAVDTSGAGDSYCAALAVGLVRGMSTREASEWACEVAALSVIHPGTIPSFPTIADVDHAKET